MIQKFLPTLVLIVSIGQVVAAATISIDAFTGDTYNQLFTLIQPAPYVFSIWGIIYTLSIIYGIYQVIPSNDNEYLQHNRIYALGAFVGSSLWLYVAGTGEDTKWITVPLLACIAWMLYRAVGYKSKVDLGDKRALLFSHKTLFPYAAWTVLATHVNVHSILNQYSLIPGALVNLFIGLLLLISAAFFTIYTLRRVSGSLWYGLVLVWASIGIVISNYYNTEQGSIVIICGALLLAGISSYYMFKK